MLIDNLQQKISETSILVAPVWLNFLFTLNFDYIFLVYIFQNEYNLVQSDSVKFAKTRNSVSLRHSLRQ